MTHKEMSEIFAVMLLAYPNAEVFKGGIAKLGPTTRSPAIIPRPALRRWST